jgi:hypothetical protein
MPGAFFVAIRPAACWVGSDFAASTRHHLPDASMRPTPKVKLYLLLFTIQITGAMAFVWQQLPEFEQVVITPGRQLPHDAFSDLVTVGVFCLMQLAFWCRL